MFFYELKSEQTRYMQIASGRSVVILFSFWLFCSLHLQMAWRLFLVAWVYVYLFPKTGLSWLASCEVQLKLPRRGLFQLFPVVREVRDMCFRVPER